MGKYRPVKFIETIRLSKAFTTWLCVCCLEPIKHGEYSFLITNMKKNSSDGQLYPVGFGVRVHVKCAERLGKDLASYAKNKEKYKVLNALDK